MAAVALLFRERVVRDVDHGVEQTDGHAGHRADAVEVQAGVVLTGTLDEPGQVDCPSQH